VIEKERFEVLLEEIKRDIKAVAEGHGVIRREMQEIKNDLKTDIKELGSTIKFVARDLGEKIDKVGQRLEEHIKLPAHMGAI